jgi:hypothetical protein
MIGLETVVVAYLMQFVSATPVVVFIANAITMWLPTKLNTNKTGLHIDAANLVLRVLNVMSLNIRENKNADDK